VENIVNKILSILWFSFLVSCKTTDSGKDPEKIEGGDKGKKEERVKQGSISKSPCSSILKKSETNCLVLAGKMSSFKRIT
jgi:hypothetical protein